jgi:hypothetical protein
MSHELLAANPKGVYGKKLRRAWAVFSDALRA